MRLLLDTQILVWMITRDRRLKKAWQEVIASPDSDLLVSAVVAVEYTELQLRRRLPVDESIAELAGRFDLEIAALPATSWEIVRDLPPFHRDPIDRLLIAHALFEGFTLVTADANIRRYDVAFICPPHDCRHQPFRHGVGRLNGC